LQFAEVYVATFAAVLYIGLRQVSGGYRIWDAGIYSENFRSGTFSRLTNLESQIHIKMHIRHLN